jgi:hypothetical protein
LQVLTLAAWEVADLKFLLAFLYAFACFAYHGSVAPHSFGLPRVCWGAVNSTPPLLGLTILMLLLLAASVLQLKQLTVLTVRLIWEASTIHALTFKVTCKEKNLT